MFNDIYGVINAIFLKAGPHLRAHGVDGRAQPSFAAVVAVDVWKTTPFMALLILAALQMLPGDIYEAAKSTARAPSGRSSR